MLHVPKVVQVPHELNGLHSEKRKVRFNRKSHERTERANGVLTLADGLVVVAGLVRDAMFVSVLPHPAVVSPVTGAGLRAVDHVLDRNVSRWPRSFPLYVDAIYEAEKFPKNAIFALEKLSTSWKDFISGGSHLFFTHKMLSAYCSWEMVTFLPVVSKL